MGKKQLILWLAVGVIVVGLIVLVIRVFPSGLQPNSRARVRQLQAETGGDLRVHWSETTGVPDFLVGRLPHEPSPAAQADPATEALNALQTYQDTFQMTDPRREFSVRQVDADRLGQTHVRLDQMHEGVPVWARDMLVHFDSDGALLGFSGEYAPGLTVAVTPTLEPETAFSVVMDELAAEAPFLEAPAELMIYIDDDNEGILTWYAPVTLATGERLGYFVDAHTGAVTHVTPLSLHNLERIIYDAELEQNLPGTLIAVEGEVPRDPSGKAVYEHLGIVYNYFLNTHGRDSFDDRGASIMVTIHSPVLGNSFWNGEMLVFGDEDNFITDKPDAFVLDIAAHEYTHAVTEYTADLIYESQSGALNEHFSDVFAVMIDREDYQLFEDNSLSPPIPKPWLRDMEDPSLGGAYDPGQPMGWGQPTDMSEYANLPITRDGDNGGVHVNSGIPNHTAYLVAQAIGREPTEQIWYRVLSVYLTRSSDFADFSTALLQATADLYGANGVEMRAVEQTLQAQGLAAGAAPAPTAIPTTGPRQTPVATPQVPSVAGCEEQIVNGGFEGRTPAPWVEVTNIGYAIVGPDFPFTGQNSAWLGGTDEEAFQYIFQQITIPANARSAALSYWYYMEENAEEKRSPDTFFGVAVADSNGNILREVIEYNSSESENEWLQDAYDLSEFAGETISLVFVASIAPTNPSNFFVDDVSLLACTTGENPVAVPEADPGSVGVTGAVTDSRNGQAIAGATIYIMQPGVTASQAAADDELTRGEVYTFAVSDKRGFFELEDRLERGVTYSAIVVASGYRNIIADNALQITNSSPDPLELEVEMQKQF